MAIKTYKIFSYNFFITGGIFDSEVGSTQELAFNIAVDFINSAEDNLPGRILVARTEKVSQLDSFGISKAICKMIKVCRKNLKFGLIPTRSYYLTTVKNPK